MRQCRRLEELLRLLLPVCRFLRPRQCRMQSRRRLRQLHQLFWHLLLPLLVPHSKIAKPRVWAAVVLRLCSRARRSGLAATRALRLQQRQAQHRLDHRWRRLRSPFPCMTQRQVHNRLCSLCPCMAQLARWCCSRSRPANPVPGALSLSLPSPHSLSAALLRRPPLRVPGLQQRACRSQTHPPLFIPVVVCPPLGVPTVTATEVAVVLQWELCDRRPRRRADRQLLARQQSLQHTQLPENLRQRPHRLQFRRRRPRCRCSSLRRRRMRRHPAAPALLHLCPRSHRAWRALKCFLRPPAALPTTARLWRLPPRLAAMQEPALQLNRRLPAAEPQSQALALARHR